jgi:hypothetical protein
VEGFHIAKQPKNFVPLGAVNITVPSRWPTTFKSEMHHHGEHFAKHIENLCNRRYLPVNVTAGNKYANCIHLEVMERPLNMNLAIREYELGTVKPGVLWCVNKIQETWNRKCEIIKKLNFELLEMRGSDPTNNLFQVSTITLKTKQAMVKKCDGCCNWCMCGFQPHIKAGNRE